MTTVNMVAPPGTSVFNAKSGTQYIVANGVIACAQGDVPDAVAAGFIASQAPNSGASGLLSTPVPFIGMKNADGTTLATSAAAGKFGLSVTPGTSTGLAGEAAQGNTKTDDAVSTFVLPAEYVAGQNITASVNVALTGTGVAGTVTAQMKAFQVKADGTMGSNIGSAAQAIVAAGSTLAFMITGTGLKPGMMLMLELEAIVQETGATNPIHAVVNSIVLS